MTTTKVVRTVETRFSIENGRCPMTHYPMGILHLWRDPWDRFTLTHSAHSYHLQPEWRDRWAAVLMADGTPIYKFVMPTVPTDDFMMVRFIYDGIWYVLELRIVEEGVPTDATQ